MIDPLSETVLPFSRAVRHIPSLRSGRPVAPATLWRWSKEGVLARSGERVKLETIRVGGSSCTSLEALKRFFARLSGREELVPATAPVGKAHEQSEAALDEAGI